MEKSRSPKRCSRATHGPTISCSLVNFFWRFHRLVGARLGLAVQHVAATLRLSAIILLIGADNALHEVVAHDVFFAELSDADTFDFSADFESLDQARFLALRQV